MSPLRRLRFAWLALVLLLSVVALVARPATADAQTSAVVINEFLTINNATLADNTGSFEDWIELHNTGGSAVDLGGWVISDGSDSFVVPAGRTIAAGGSCPLADPVNQLVAAAGDVNDDGRVDIGDALLVAQCPVGVPNIFCTR